MRKLFKTCFIMMLVAIIPSMLFVLGYYIYFGYTHFEQPLFTILNIVITEKSVWYLVLVYSIFVFFIALIYVVFLIRNYKFKYQPFSKLDKDFWMINKGNNRYIWGIQLLNNFYRKDGDIKDIIDTNNIELLYKRKDYLEKKNGVKTDLVSCLVSMLVSFSVAIMMETNEEDFFLMKLLIVLFVVAIIGFATFIRMSLPFDIERNYNLNEYEIALVDIAISDIQKKLEIVYLDHFYIDTKYNVLALLKEKKKIFPTDYHKAIGIDIKKIEDMIMTKVSYANLNKASVKLKNGMDIFLIVDKEWKKGENIQEHLVDEYIEMYNILNKYDLLAE